MHVAAGYENARLTKVGVGTEYSVGEPLSGVPKWTASATPAQIAANPALRLVTTFGTAGVKTYRSSWWEGWLVGCEGGHFLDDQNVLDSGWLQVNGGQGFSPDRNTCV